MSKGDRPSEPLGPRPGEVEPPPFDPDLDLLISIEKPQGPDDRPWWRRLLGL